MDDAGKARRSRLLRERGRPFRRIRFGPGAGDECWIGHHRETGLLIFDRGAQRGIETGRVRLFVVKNREHRLFMREVIRARPLWSSVDGRLAEEMRRAVREYGRFRLGQRKTHCYSCRRKLDAVNYPFCAECGWIQCPCGRCGCHWKPPAASDS